MNYVYVCVCVQEEIQRYKQDKHKLEQYGVQLYSLFLAPDAASQVNVKSDVRKSVCDAVRYYDSTAAAANAKKLKKGSNHNSRSSLKGAHRHDEKEATTTATHVDADTPASSTHAFSAAESEIFSLMYR